jgi:hypothetical protein
VFVTLVIFRHETGICVGFEFGQESDQMPLALIMPLCPVPKQISILYRRSDCVQLYCSCFDMQSIDKHILIATPSKHVYIKMWFKCIIAFSEDEHSPKSIRTSRRLFRNSSVRPRLEVDIRLYGHPTSTTSQDPTPLKQNQDIRSRHFPSHIVRRHNQ